MQSAASHYSNRSIHVLREAELQGKVVHVAKHHSVKVYGDVEAKFHHGTTWS